MHFEQNPQYATQSGEITGILKEMNDKMLEDPTDATNAETTALENYEVLPAAKKKDIDALTASLESKTQRIGELTVALVQLKNDLTDTEEALLAD